jgi:MFS family permease
MLVGSPIAGRLSDRFGPRPLMTIGPLVAAAGLVLALRAGPGSGYWNVFFPSLLVFVVGMATTVAPLTTAALSSLEARHAGVASGVNNAVARLAGLLAIAILPALTLSLFSSTLESRLPALDLPPGANAAIVAEEAKQGGLEPPPGLSPERTAAVEAAVDESFVAGYRLAMVVCAGLLVLGGVTAFLTVRMPGSSERADDPTGTVARSEPD